MSTAFEALMRWWHVRPPETGETPLSAAEIAYAVAAGLLQGGGA